MDLVGLRAIRLRGLVPMLTRARPFGVALRIVAPGVPARRDRVRDSLDHPIEGQDDGEALGGAPNHIQLGRALVVPGTCLGEVFDLNRDELGQVVFGEILSDVEDELRGNILSLEGRGALGELEWNQGAALDLEEGGVNLVLSEKLAVDGRGPGPVHAVDARRGSLKANRLLGDRVVTMKRVNTKEVAHAMFVDDGEHVLDVLGVRALKPHLRLDGGKPIIPRRDGHSGQYIL